MSSATALAHKHGIAIIRNMELKNAVYDTLEKRLFIPIDVKQKELKGILHSIIKGIEEDTLARKHNIEIHRSFEAPRISYDINNKKLTIPMNMKHESIELILQGLINENESKKEVQPEKLTKPKSHLRVVV